MKKIFTIFALTATVILASCSKDPIGGTAVQDMSGEWFLQVDVVDETGELLAEDIIGGHFIGLTFNVNSNDPDMLYVSDNGGYFWDYKAQVPCDLKTLTFGAQDLEIPNEAYESNVMIWNGKITPGGAVTPSGGKADAIEYLISFDDDDAEYCTIYKVHGWRYTGFAADEDGGAAPIQI